MISLIKCPTCQSKTDASAETCSGCGVALPKDTQTTQSNQPTKAQQPSDLTTNAPESSGPNVTVTDLKTVNKKPFTKKADHK